MQQISTAPPPPTSDDVNNYNGFYVNQVPVKATPMDDGNIVVAVVAATDAKQCSPPTQTAIHYPYLSSTSTQPWTASYATSPNNANSSNANVTSLPPSQSVSYGNDMGTEQRRTHKCCGCCCDVRRAVIIVDCIYIVMIVFAMITVANRVEDIEEAFPGAVSDDRIQFIYFMFSLQVAAMVVGIFGAVQYNKFMVGIALISFAYDIYLSISPPVSIPAVILVLCFIYPHLGLIVELHKGSMSRERYEIEKHSCCCV